MAAGHVSGAAEEWQLLVSRVFDAPRGLVFAAWSDPDLLAQWWGPKGFTIRVLTLDFRPGGVFHYVTKSPHGQEMWGTFVYREIVPPERIVFVSAFADEAGNPTRSPFSPTWPLHILNLLTLTEDEGKTTLTLRATPYNATAEERETFVAARDSLWRGYAGTMDTLATFLKTRLASTSPHSDGTEGGGTSAGMR